MSERVRGHILPSRTSKTPLVRITAAIALALPAMLLATGCATVTEGPEFVPVQQGSYERAFDAACAVAREEGLIPEITDRRAGSIETQPRTAGSLLEPWAWQDLTASEVVEGTFGFERRRALALAISAGSQCRRQHQAALLPLRDGRCSAIRPPVHSSSSKCFAACR
jgi:hypothetical protein